MNALLVAVRRTGGGHVALRLAAALSGALVIAWALVDPRHRSPEGTLEGAVCLPLAIGGALLVVACAGRGALAPAAGWLALAIAGQAVALQLVDAGHFLRYQHYQPFGRIVREHPALLGFLVAQVVAVALGLWARWSPLRAWWSRHLRSWRLALLAMVIVLPSATVSRDVGRYVGELALAGFVQALSLANIILAVWAVPRTIRDGFGRRLERLLDPDGRGPDRLTLLAAGWVTVVAAALSVLVYERHPHVTDEVVYLHHARYLARGLLSLPAPPVPPAFDFYLMQLDGARWFSVVPPGWPAVLAVGTFLGVPWLVNPVLAGANVILSSRLVRELYDRPTARAVALLLAVSPWHVFMAMSFMTHPATLTAALVAAIAVARARVGGRSAGAWGALGGLALGAGFLLRPLDGMLVAGLVGLWALGLGGRRVPFTALAALALGAIVVGGLTLPYNQHLTGDAGVFPINSYLDQRYGKNSNAYGFGPDRGMGWPIDPFPGHGPIDGVINADLNTFSMNVELFGWSAGSLLLIVMVPLLGRLRGADAAMVAVMAAVFVAYFFYYFSGGPDFGARYWYLMLLPCVVLTARGIEALNRAIAPGQPLGGAASIAVVGLCLIALLDFFPWRAIDKYHHYLGMRPDLRRLAVDGGFGSDLVLVRGRPHPDYASAVIENPLDLTARAPVFAWDRDPAVRAQVLASYRDRRVWLVNGPSVTGRGFEIVRGPISAPELLAESHAR